jgi:hypothetical protein
MISVSTKNFLAVTIAALGLTQMGYSQTGGEYLIEPFRPHGYTSGFTKGLEYEIELSGKSENFVVNGQWTYVQDVGKKISRFGKEWTGVTYKGFFKFNEEKIDINGIDLYDIKTNLKTYSIDTNDGEITQYVWRKFPEKMKSEQVATVAQFSKRNKSGKTIGQGTVEWSLVAAPTGYEFCEIEKTIDLKTKEESESRDCDVFDTSKRIVGGYIEITIDKTLKISGSGPVKLR